ncbi:MAG: helix-hairpin-helix domain-containing protein, partial [Candidatus Dependentiae bacterium]|nr:helix-hairpin-helix domain-containing protein [Candidatus Dependentiae bacterium]
GPSLYGFSDPLERTAFLLIISCSGIGPKLALALLRQLTPAAFFSAIMLSDSKVLSSVSGVGTKKAEALILNLKDKVNKMNQDGSLGNLKAHAGHIHDVAQALGSLEYSRSEIAAVLDQLPQQIAIETASFQDLMRKALSLASKQRTTLQN